MSAVEELKAWAATHITAETVLDHKNIVLFAGGFGLLSRPYFRRFEPDVYSFLTFHAYFILGLAFLFHQFTSSWVAVAGHTLEAVATYNAVLTVATVLYRLSPWHPLAAYPGPVAAKISKWYWWREAQRGQTGYTQDRLHRQYNSDVIRLGPNWISVRSANSIPQVYGGTKSSGRTPWLKSDWYEGAYRFARRVTLQMEVNVDNHAIRRRLWDQAFTPKAIADYKPDILSFCDKLTANVAAAAAAGQPINMTLQSHCFSFDVMGILGFGAPFGMLETSKRHFYVETLEKGMQALVPLHEIPWMHSLMRRLLPLPQRLKIFEQQNNERFERRLAQGSTRRDIFTYLLGEETGPKGETYKLTRDELLAEAGLIVVAGSDTTSSLLTWFWFYNVANPGEYAKLRAELDAISPEHVTDTGMLAKLPYLNAALNETMRLQPAVPGGLRRVVPEGGALLDGKYFVPEGTSVSIPTFSIHHDARWWGPDVESYRPERWLNATAEGLNTKAFLPFAYGSRICPGRNLALTEARLAVVDIVRRFEFQFPPGFDTAEYEQGVRDHFTIQNPELNLIPVARTPVAPFA